jgi:hypothetical protein
VIIVLVALGLMMRLLLPEHKDLLIEILKLLVVFGGGVGAGYGIRSSQK